MQSHELVKAYFSASYVVLTLWMGYGLLILGALLTKPGRLQPASAP